MDNSEQPLKPANKIWRTTGKVLGILAVVVVTLFSILLIAAKLVENTVRDRIVAEINKTVTVPIQVKGDIDFSIVRHFPSASLTFKQVSIDDRLRKGKKLMEVEEFSLLCNLFSLFGKEPEFTKVVISNGQLSMYTDANGKNNFNIFGKSEGESALQSIKLKKAQIKNVRYTYNDKSQRTITDLRLKDAIFRGNFGQDMFSLDAYGKIFVYGITVAGEPYMSGKNIGIDASMEVDKKQGRYAFTRGKLDIEKSEFTITGFFTLLKNATQLNFSLKNSGKDIANLLSLLPAQIQENMAGAAGTGEYAIEADIKGKLSKTTYPVINVKADLKDSEIKFGRYNKFLKKVNASAKYESDAQGNNLLVISNFNCTLNDLPFQVSLTLKDLSNPTFDFYANGVLHLAEIASFIPDSVLQEPDGKIHFNKFHLKGKKSDFTEPENSSLTGSGDFRFDGAEFRQNGITYGNINGLLKYENQVIEAQGLTLNFLSTDFAFTGSISNLFAYVYMVSQRRTSPDVVLGINGAVKMNTFNLTGILEAYDKKNKPAQQRRKVNIRDIFNMRGNLQVEVKRFVYKQMEFKELAAGIQMAPGLIRINSLNAGAMGGEVKVNGLISFLPDAFNMNCNITAVQMEIPKIFKQCENFGQTTLTDKHLKGTLTAALTLNATWLNYKDIDQNSLAAVVDFDVKHGELIKFEPLRAASKFIRVEELEHIRFSDLTNTIRIADKKIEIPQFEIKSSALNLIFSGTHNFDNIVDYHFKVNLHKVLAQKFNRNVKEVQYIEEDPYEGLNIFLTMTGPLDNPSIKYDKQGAKNKIKDDFKKQKDELRMLMKGEKLPVNENERKREEKYFDLREQPQFMEFEEDK